MVSTINLPMVGTYVKVRTDLENRDAILKGLRGPYGTSTKKAFKVLGYYVRDSKSVGLIIEDVWGQKAYLDSKFFVSM